MAEDTAAQSTGEQGSASAPKRKNVVMIGVLVGVMLIEAVVVFILVKHFTKATNPTETHAETGGLEAKEGRKPEPELEVKIGEFRVQNRKGQQAYNVSFSVFATVPPTVKPEGEKGKKEAKEGEGEGGGSGPKGRPEDAAVAAKAAKIKDRITRVIRSMEPESFTEPDLTTLRGKLKEELGHVMGDELKIKEVLLTDFSCSAES